MTTTFVRRAAAGLAGVALAASGLAIFGASTTAFAAPGDVDRKPVEFDPESAIVGQTNKITWPFEVEGATTGPIDLELSNADGLDCEITKGNIPTGSEGDQEVTANCTPTREGDVEVDYAITYASAAGPQVFDGVIGVNPSAPEPSAPSPSEPSSPASPSEPAPSEPSSPASPTSPASPSAPSTSVAPSPTASSSAPVAKPVVTTGVGQFNPNRLAVEAGKKFTFTKSVTIKNAALTSDLWIKLSDYKNLKCEPMEDKLPAGTKPGTYDFKFTCTFVKDGSRAQATYTIWGKDLPKPEVGSFGFGDVDAPSGGGKPKDRDTSGGLADTGAPALGVVLAGGVAAATAGGLLIRRRNAK